MNSELTRPLVTFALLTYNQEAFVRSAIRGALSQTYSPLEIICSDDCSSDATVAIIRDELARYSGMHAIRLNVNPTNLGLAAHLCHVFGLARGELIVLAAGDDISFAERTQVLVETWLREGRRIMSLFSGYEVIDTTGRQVGRNVPPEGYHSANADQRIGGIVHVEGATHAFHRKLYDDFGNFLPGTINEDVVLQFRACLRDGVYVLSRPLARYRKHNDSLTALSGGSKVAGGLHMSERSQLHWRQKVLDNFAKDLRIAISHAWLSPEDGRRLLNKVQHQACIAQTRLHSYTSHGFRRWMYALRSLYSPVPLRLSLRDFLLLSWPAMFLWLRRLKSHAKPANKMTDGS